MPSPAIAKQVLKLPDGRQILRFDVYDTRFHTPLDDPYNDVVRQLEVGGIQRNVFLADNHGCPIWRVEAFPPPRGSQFVDIRLSDNSDVVNGSNSNGDEFEITISNGTLKWISWQK